MHELFEHNLFSSDLPQTAVTEISALLQEVFGALPAHLAILDENGVILTVNRAWCDFADANGLRDPTYGVGKSYFAVCATAAGFDADVAQAAGEGLRQILAGERLTFTLEYPCHSSEHRRWFLLRASSFRTRGKGYGVVLHEDITPRVVAEASAQWVARLPVESSNSVLRALIDTVPANVYIKDTHSRFVDANLETALQMGAKTSNDLIGKTDADFLSAELAEKFFANEQAILQSGQPMRNIEELSFDYRTQQENWLLTTEVPIFDDQGKVTGLVGVSLDITERKRIEKALEEERTLLRTLIDAMPDYIYIKDRESRFVLGNTATALSLGAATPDDIVGKTDFDFHPPDLAARFFAEEQALLQSGKPMLSQEEVVIDQRTGEWQHLLSTNMPLYDNQGQITGLVGVNRDITERKRAEAQAFVLAAEQQRGELLRAFITDVSHDFRTPLAIVGTSAFLIRKTMVPVKLTQYSQRIEEQISRLSLLLDNFVELAALERQVSSLPFQSADLDGLVKAVLEQSQPQIAEKHQQLDYRCETPSLVTGDPAALSRVITQVVVNALHYTPAEGKITLRLYSEGENAVLEVADTGIGIPAAELPHIFESFYRVDSSRSTRTGGAGLGLSIAKRIVELMKGSIEVESEFGAGSIFRLYLPLYKR